MATIHLYGVLETAENLKTKKEKIEFLRNNRCPALDKLLRLTFHDDITFELPDTVPPYKPSEFDEWNNIHQEMRKIERTFLKGTLPDFKQSKREAVFIQILEYVDKDDAKLLTGMITKSLPFKTINKKLVQEALPELFESVSA